MKRTIRLVGEQQRETALNAINELPVGQADLYEVVIRKSQQVKSRIQEEKYHAMIGDIARQHEFCGRLWDSEDMKRLLIDGFRRDTKDDPELKEEWAKHSSLELAPSLDGTGTVMLGVQSRKFSVKLATAFIEWLFAFGGENNIAWSET